MIHVLNGVCIFFEKTGDGPPLILLHGNGESHRIFHKIIEPLARKYTVYAIDSRGHGKSTRVQSLHYEQMSEDVVALIREEGLTRPALFGFSDGGIIGLMIAIRHPELLSKLIVSGVNISPDGIKKRWLDLFRLLFRLTRSDKIKMMLTEPNISTEQLGEILCPVLILAGSKDLIREEHTRKIAGAIRGADLRILDGENHGSYVIHSSKLLSVIPTFLDDEIKAATET
ncbi:MAG: alpha/beta hydrolase [Clostridiaceae bacterium]|nr:alpha/beta hydrolase [Clostridiaceae bacterium]